MRILKAILVPVMVTFLIILLFGIAEIIDRSDTRYIWTTASITNVAYSKYTNQLDYVYYIDGVEYSSSIEVPERLFYNVGDRIQIRCPSSDLSLSWPVLNHSLITVYVLIWYCIALTSLGIYVFITE